MPLDLVKELSCYLSYRTCRRLLTIFPNINSDDIWTYKIMNEFDLPYTVCNTVLPLHIRYIELKSDTCSDLGTDLFGYPRPFSHSLAELEVFELLNHFKKDWFTMMDRSADFLCTYYAQQGNAEKFIETYEQNEKHISSACTDELYVNALSSSSAKISKYIREKLHPDEIETTETVLYYSNCTIDSIRKRDIVTIKRDQKFIQIYHILAEHKHWDVIDHLLNRGLNPNSELIYASIYLRNIDKLKYYYNKCDILNKHSILDSACDNGILDTIEYILSLDNFRIEYLTHAFKYAVHYYHIDIAIYLHNKLNERNVEMDFPLQKLLNELTEKFKNFE